MSNLTSHEKYTLYKYCLSLGVPEDTAVAIREQSKSTLESLLKHRSEVFTEIEEILYGAFLWSESEEGFHFWNDFISSFKNKGETK